MSGQLKEGDVVSFLDEVGGGVILAVQESGLALVETEDGFRIPVHTSNLVLRQLSIESDLLKVTDRQAQERSAHDSPNPKAVRSRYENPSGKRSKREKDAEGTIEVDIHLHQILENERGMSNGDKLNYQLRYFERMLNTAIDEKKRKMIVIHGVGEGRLREEVHNVLRHYPGVRFRDADPRRFGNGATEVELGTY